jgi:hypothetical protein
MPRSVKDACFQASQIPAAYAKITEVYLKRCAGAVEEYVAALSKATSALRDATPPAFAARHVAGRHCLLACASPSPGA